MDLKEVNSQDPSPTSWKKVYLLVLAWFVFFNLLMYLFTIFTA